MLSLYHRLIAIRRASAALSVGTYQVQVVDDHVLSYVRAHAGEQVLIVLNFSSTAAPRQVRVPDGHIVLSTYLDRAGDRVSDSLDVRADEGLLIALNSSAARA
jgi:alpha-glucosidase